MATLAGIANFHKVPELRRRVIFTLVMLAVYRIGVFVTVPGVDRAAMSKYMAKQSGGLLNFFNMFSGGALENFSLFALGIMPYISASIIIQLMGMVYKPIDELRKEGEQGRRKIDQYTRYGTVALSLFQAYGSAKLVEGWSASDAGAGIVTHPGLGFQLMTMITLTTGTAFLMWIGEQITERGIGNGISLLIFAGIVTGVPGWVGSYLATNAGNIQPLTISAVGAFVVAAIAVIAFFENGRRQIPIVYSRRQVGRRVYGAQNAHLPLKVNTAGTIPPIFASSLLMFPATLANMNVPGADKLQSIISGGGWVFNTGYALLIVFFCYFYTSVTFQPVDVAENLKKQQANIPGIRPGKQTADYIQGVMNRITFGGAMYVAAVCVLPSVVGDLLRVQITFGGTSLMIVVGVALDTVNQIEAQLITRSYEGLTGPGASRIRARRLPEG
ncbi:MULTISPECIES: preprotein translocase subunit SecY [Polyangium]|uniref:Protein translocase subunit SecY n=1 Tax=Polyangium jinanense TaxID=2829994 RepID=A0A9X4ARW6_9BACT|nr:MULTISPECIES: preprotein translocase subunit SecY [Polyangium]MDC3952241.1 preprotein translocase subunit SecY [Polyangium jinanense]MDC3956386.1 preprotein translocase subunit SecY [Polyangium jinanense]MDC3979870.1 preprotein translocase subunit SecY [Polyangium jinanense]MDC3982523.1 preprotein translocase subunit SecY [Polyangium jinanense]MDI3289974.1 preprotein translocase subunit SecY [Polyangium sp. 15x6]